MMQTIQRKFWSWTLRRLRAAVWVMDEWIHTQELKQRVAPSAPVSDEFDPQASRQRERVIRKAIKRAPRLQYVHGEFVREN